MTCKLSNCGLLYAHLAFGFDDTPGGEAMRPADDGAAAEYIGLGGLMGGVECIMEEMCAGEGSLYE